MLATILFDGFNLFLCTTLTLAAYCWRRRCSRRQPRRLNDGGRYRELGPESDSQADDVGRPCHAMRIGVLGDRGMRPLAPQGCQDEAQHKPTTLLQEGAEVSDVGPRIKGDTTTTTTTSCTLPPSALQA